MRKRLGADRWRELFSEFDSEEVTVAQFCDSAGVSVQTFYKWRKKLNSESAPAAGSRFVSVVVAPSPNQLEIELPGGAVARVPNDAASIRPLIEVLVELGGRS